MPQRALRREGRRRVWDRRRVCAGTSGALPATGPGGQSRPVTPAGAGRAGGGISRVRALCPAALRPLQGGAVRAGQPRSQSAADGYGWSPALRDSSRVYMVAAAGDSSVFTLPAIGPRAPWCWRGSSPGRWLFGSS